MPIETPRPHPARSWASGSPLPSLGAGLARQDRGVGGEGKVNGFYKPDLVSYLFLSKIPPIPYPLFPIP